MYNFLYGFEIKYYKELNYINNISKYIYIYILFIEAFCSLFGLQYIM